MISLKRWFLTSCEIGVLKWFPKILKKKLSFINATGFLFGASRNSWHLDIYYDLKIIREFLHFIWSKAKPNLESVIFHPTYVMNQKLSFQFDSFNNTTTVKSLIVTALDYKPPSNSNRTFFTHGRIEIETALD